MIIVSLIVQEQRHGRNEEWESSVSRPSVKSQKVIGSSGCVESVGLVIGFILDDCSDGLRIN